MQLGLLGMQRTEQVALDEERSVCKVEHFRRLAS